MFLITTYFDRNYLSRGLVLYDSLKKHCEQFTLYILCLDKYTLEYFFENACRYPEVISLSLDEVEEFDTEFKQCKENRSIIEYYFTLSPCLPLYLLKKFNLPHICSLDADIMFFSSPAVVFSYLGKYSIIITPHSFSPELKSLEIYGIYNVSFQIFKNDDRGLKCLEYWRKQCINWCYDKLEDGKYADQKYLDNWVEDFKGVYAIDIPGIGVAPWNLDSYKITFHENQLYINKSKIIFYHFHGLRIVNRNLIIHGMSKYNVKVNKLITRQIYRPYIKNLLSFDTGNDAEIERHIISLQTAFQTVLFQNNWYFYKSGLIFRKSYFFDLLIRGINYISKKIVFTHKQNARN
jgi:hypothetical protein